MTDKSNSKTEKDKSQSSNKSKTGEPKVNEKSESEQGKKSKKEKSSSTVEKSKNEIASKLKTPKRDLTDSEYERFIEYEKTRNAEKEQQDNFKMEVTPKEISIDPDAPLKVTVKCMAGCSQEVLVELDSFLFEIVNSKKRKGQKTQIYKDMEHEETLEFEIRLRDKTKTSAANYDPVEDPRGFLKICHKPYRYYGSSQWDPPKSESDKFELLFRRRYRKGKSWKEDLMDFGKLTERDGLQKWSIQWTKETDQLKKMIAPYNEKKEVEKALARNHFQMDVNPKNFLSIDPDVPFKVSVKSLAKEKQKLIVEVESFYLKVMNQMGQHKFATQICCTIMPQETLNFEIGLKSEEEARKSKEGSDSLRHDARLIIYNIKFEAEDEKKAHWTPYKPNCQQANPIFVHRYIAKKNGDHGHAEWRMEMISKETEATKMLKKVYYERKEDKKDKEEKEEKKKKKCVIQ